MQTVLEQLIQITSAKDHNTKGFAMLHCASYLKDNKLEGEVKLKAFNYLATVTRDTNAVSASYLSQEHKDLCTKAVDDLIYFATCYKTVDRSTIDPIPFIKLIKDRCQNTNFCYLPSGWQASKGGHAISVKVTKIDENTYDIAYLNRGAGCQYHSQLGISDEKLKYDYQSHVYRFDINSDSAKLFFYGILWLSGSSENSCDEQDLYGLLALHGSLQESIANPIRMVTPQRSGTCALTNARASIKDTLLFNAKLPIETIKRYEFFNKLASIVIAYKHITDSEKKHINEDDLQLVALALKELYVRLEKSHPQSITDEELLEIRRYADDINSKITSLQKALIAAACKEQPLPEITTIYQPAPIQESTKTFFNPVQTDATTQASFKVKNCSPEQVVAYLQEAVDYFVVANKTPHTIWEAFQCMHSLAPTSAAKEDPFWDKVPDTQLNTIIHALVKLNQTLRYIDLPSNYKQELALISYDIAAQLAPRIPELQLGIDYCLGLDDCFSNNVYSQPITFLTVSKLADNFKKRTDGKAPIFTNSVLNESTTFLSKNMETYLLSFLDNERKTKILKHIQADNLTDKQWFDLLLTNTYKRKSYNLADYFPPVLNDIRRLAAFSQNSDTVNYSKGYFGAPSVFYQGDYYLGMHTYQRHKQIAVDYSKYDPAVTERSAYVKKFRSVIPFKQIRTNSNGNSDFAESAIYQPHASRVGYREKENKSLTDLSPWNTDYTGDFLTDSIECFTQNQVDEAFKRMQLDDGFMFQRALIWLEDNACDCFLFSPMHLMARMYKYGAIYHALTNNPEETNQQIKKTLNQVYSYLQGIHQEIRHHADLDSYLRLCNLETNYRNWAISLNKADLLDEQFPSCQLILRKCWGSVKQEFQEKVAIALLANLKTLSPLNADDLSYALACQILLMSRPKSQQEYRLTIASADSYAASEAWNVLKYEINQSIQSMSAEERNAFMSKVLAMTGYKQYALDYSEWLFEESFLISKDKRLCVNLESGTLTLDGEILENIQKLYTGVMQENLDKVLAALDIAPEKLTYVRIPEAEPVEGCQFQADSNDGTRFYFGCPTSGVPVVKKFIPINNRNYLCTLITNYVTSYSYVDIATILEKNKLFNPYKKPGDRQILWHDTKNNQFLIQHHQHKDKAMWSDSSGIWHKVLLKDGSWQSCEKVLLNAGDTNNSLIRSWSAYLSRITMPHSLRYKAKLDEASMTLTLQKITLTKLNLHFVVENNRLCCREFTNFYLSQKQGLEELNGINSVVILENANGEYKYLLSKAEIIKEGQPFYSSSPLCLESAKGYILLQKDKQGRWRGKTAEDNMRIAIVYAMQGDYKNAMDCLHYSYSHKPNSQEMVDLMENYFSNKPNTPAAYAFYYQLHQRFLAHEFKWTKTYKPVLKEHARKKLDEDAKKNMIDYMECISAQKEKVSIIPKFLEIPKKDYVKITTWCQPSFKPFSDELFSKTNTQKIKDVDSILGFISRTHCRQANFPFYPPLKFIAKKEQKSGINTHGDDFYIVDQEAIIYANFINLFDLALSNEPTDTERFTSYLFHILHSFDNHKLTENLLIACTILRYVNNNKAKFKHIQDHYTHNVFSEITKVLKNNINTTNTEQFSTEITSAELKSITKAPHWLKEKKHCTFCLDNVVFDEAIKQPLREVLNSFCNTDESPRVAVKGKTATLKTASANPPMVNKIIENYKRGFEINLSRTKPKYTLKPDGFAQIKNYVSQAIINQQKALTQREEQLIQSANQLPKDREWENVCNLIQAARESGKRPAIDIATLMMSLLKQKTEALTESNPFLTKEQINTLLQLTCDYALEHSKLSQYKEVEHLINEHPDVRNLPKWVEQLLGETLAKERSYEPKEYPEMLVYEYATGNMLREGQADCIQRLIAVIASGNLKGFRHALLQFKAGGGKTAVLIPILAHRFARMGLLPIIFNTNELYAIAEQEIPESLKQSLLQNMEVVEVELDFKWSTNELQKILANLKLWQSQGKALLIKATTWHSINLTYKEALNTEDLDVAHNAKQVLDFFSTQCIKLEDECHLISDPLQQSIRTDVPSQTFTVAQTDLMLEFYHDIMGDTTLRELTGIKDNSKKTVSDEELTQIQASLVDKLLKKTEFSSINKQNLQAYVQATSKKRPTWLCNLFREKPALASNIVLARSFIKTHLPHIITLQYQRDYGPSAKDLTAVPKHDGCDVSSHFADPLLVMALTTQMAQQQGVPSSIIKTIFDGLKTNHIKQSKSSPILTEAQIQMLMLLPEEYWKSNAIETLDTAKLAEDKTVQFHPALIDYYLKTCVYPKIKVPKIAYVSTSAELQAGFKASILCSATPGPQEAYSVYLEPENLLVSPEFEAEVISRLLSDTNNQGILLENADSPEAFFANMHKTDPEQYANMTAFIDRGALMTNYQNTHISQALQKFFKDNTLFFTGDSMQLASNTKNLQSVTLKGTCIVEALEQQGFTLEQFVIFMFLDLAHTTGTDVKRPYKDRAGLTIGKEQTLTDTIQAAMRERQLLRDDAQSVVWVLFQDLYTKINPNASEFDLNQVFLWMIQNQAKRDEHKILMRAYQGIEQLIESHAQDLIATGALKPEAYRRHLAKPMDLSIWSMYELESEDGPTEVILQAYVHNLKKQLGMHEHYQLPDAVNKPVQRIITETSLLVPTTKRPHGSELSAEVLHEQEQQQQQKQEQQQQQEQKQTLLTIYNSKTDIELMLEIYDDKDVLEAIFANNNANYVNLTLPGCEHISLPALIINPRHFVPIVQKNYERLQFLKPIDNVIIQCQTDGSYRYLACSLMGAKVFREQLKNREWSADSPSYIIMNSFGTFLYKSTNASPETVRNCRLSPSFVDMLAYLELLQGQITRTKAMHQFLVKYAIDKTKYNNLVSAIKQIHVSPKPVELEDLPYLESLCGWRTLDKSVEEYLANKTEHLVEEPVPTKASKLKNDTLPARAVIGYLADIMASILPPCVLDNPLNTPHLFTFGVPAWLVRAREAAMKQEEEQINNKPISPVIEPTITVMVDGKYLEKKSEFMTSLKVLREKAATLRSRGYITAANEAADLDTALGTLADVYFANPTKKTYEEFKTKTRSKIAAAIDKELGKHREIKHILANIALLIIGLGVFYLAAVAINGGFFFMETHASKIANTIDKTIREDQYAPK